jgi:hypothetical protein
MNCYLINATSIKAFWGLGHLYLTASGDTECPQYANISQSPIDIFPPEYQITTCACPEIGTFPYNIHAWFELGVKPETVTVHTADGAEKVDVEAFPADLIQDVRTPRVLTAEPSDNEVVGFSPNSWDINRAITDAVSKLQKLYPGKVNATLTETGVVAAGSPIGIAFLYVKMKQTVEKPPSKSSSKRKSS